MIQDVDLSGNAFIRRVGDRLERLRPDWVLIVSGEDEDTDVREVTGYVYYDGGIGVDDDPMLLPVEDVAHWSPVPDPLAAYRGMSWLTPVVREIDADSAMVVHKGKFFVNGATPNLLVKYPSVIGPETLDRLKTQIQSRFAGSENAYKTMVLDQGADVTVIGSQMAEMAFTAVQSAGESRIAAAGGVPPIVAHLQAGLESTSYAYAREALKTFLHGTLHYLWVSASQTLSKLVVVPAGCELYYDRTDIPALRESEVERQNANQAAAATIASLVMQGFTPQSSVAATVAADLSLLQHSGALSVQLYPNGEAPPVLEAVASEPPVINVDARTSVAEGAFQMTMPVDARTETHTTIADGAVRASIDGTTHVEVDPGAVQVTNEITQAQPAAVRKQVETDEAGRITAIVETPAG
jgi:HK97 family phage portal protein